ncbi:MAG: Mor transcription activator family protein [[Eubacterium] siraeum]
MIREYNGKNILKLAKKYDYSERSIWRIIRTSKTK